MGNLKYHMDVNDAIKGNRVIVEAGKIDPPHVHKKSSRDRGQRTMAKGDARAWVDTPVRRGQQFSL